MDTLFVTTEYDEPLSEERMATIRKDLPGICQISSEQEVNALEAERKSIKIMQAKFMVNKIGEVYDKIGKVYDGIISEIVRFGIFVEIVDFLVEGLIHIKELAGENCFHDESNYRLIGKTTGNIYRLGDRLKIQVIKVIPEEK